MLFENVESDIERMERFAKQQHDQLKNMAEDANTLKEYYMVLKISLEIIFGIVAKNE